MNLYKKPLRPVISRGELVKLCNEKLVCAARDLAEFTKMGLTASFIVAMAHKCEALQERLGRSDSADKGTSSADLEGELHEALSRICKVGQQIWLNEPVKYSDYLLPNEQLAQPGSNDQKLMA